MATSRYVIAALALSLIVVLGLAISLSMKVDEIESLQMAYATEVGELERQRDRLLERIQALQEELREKSIQLEALRFALEETRRQLQRYQGPTPAEGNPERPASP